MALLKGERYAVNSDGHKVEVYEVASGQPRHTIPMTPNEIAQGMGQIWHDEGLSEEERCFAIFWAGYFYGSY